jgi:hypothetical protein
MLMKTQISAIAMGFASAPSERCGSRIMIRPGILHFMSIVEMQQVSE